MCPACALRLREARQLTPPGDLPDVIEVLEQRPSDATTTEWRCRCRACHRELSVWEDHGGHLRYYHWPVSDADDA